MENAIEWGFAAVNEIYIKDNTDCSGDDKDTIFKINNDLSTDTECVARAGILIQPPNRKIVCVEKTGLFGE